VARISGVDLPKEKRIETALTYLYGIGLKASKDILIKTSIDPNKRVKDLTEAEVGKLRQVIDSDYRVEGALRTEIQMNIKRLMNIGCYRGIRHRRGLPVRGQRTSTNARTHKGRKRTIGSKRKK
jgi:small subunit ribosomal protein S13